MIEYPKTMYRTSGRSIGAAKVVSETAKYVTVEYPAIFDGGKPYTRREAKNSDYSTFFGTWEDAKSYLVTRQEQEVISLRAQLEGAKGRLGQLRGMKPPKVES